MVYIGGGHWGSWLVRSDMGFRAKLGGILWVGVLGVTETSKDFQGLVSCQRERVACRKAIVKAVREAICQPLEIGGISQTHVALLDLLLVIENSNGEFRLRLHARDSFSITQVESGVKSYSSQVISTLPR